MVMVSLPKISTTFTAILRRPGGHAARLVEDVGEKPHLELETEDIDLGDVLLAALQDDLLDEEPRHRQVDRPHRHQPPGALAVEGGEIFTFSAR